MGEGNAKTKSYCVKHRGYKKKGGVVDNHGGVLITGVFVGVDWVCER